MSKYSIPVVNFVKLAVNNKIEPQKIDYKLVGQEVAKAFQNIGFVYLENHGIPQNLIKETHEVSESFFSLPISTKEKYSKTSLDEERDHGYVTINREKLDSDKATSEIRESYDIKCLNGQFPDKECPGLKSKAVQLHKLTLQLSFRLLEALEIALDTSRGALLNLHNKDLVSNGTLMRLLHYPPISTDVEAGTVRCGTHSDYGTFALLFQDSMGGLEVLDRSGVWQKANPIPGTILVNVGDLLQIWTGDKFIATKHRVLVPEEEVRRQCSRSSIVLFFHPNCDVMVRPLDGSSKYKPINAKEHVINRYNSTYKY